MEMRDQTVLRCAVGPLLLIAVSALACAAPSRGQNAGEESAEPAISLPPGIKVLRDVAYGDDPLQRMDVYLPRDAKQAPTVFMVHGGAWAFGDKTNGRVVANKVARWTPCGFAFVSINTRLLPKADPLRQAEDVAKALAFAQTRALQWGANPAQFILMGHSAGAHLVALISAAPTRAYALGARAWLGTVVLDSAALDVEGVMQRRHLPLYDRAFGQAPDYWRTVSPMHQLSASALPMLLVCSERRTDDSCGTAGRFAEKAASLGVRAKVLPEDLSHAEINENAGLPGAYTDAIEQFMRGLDTSVASALAGR
jgi:acetyl esterase/lipase